MYLIDTHCHLHDREFFTDAQAKTMLENARTRGVQQIICIGTNHEDSLNAKAFAESRPNVFWTYGIHPEEAGSLESPFVLNKENPQVFRNDLKGEQSVAGATRTALRASLSVVEKNMTGFSRAQKELSNDPCLVAIGEVGLDYHYEGYNRKNQIKLLEQMLDLAVKLNLPCSFHVRDALPDFFVVIKNFSNLKPSVLHSFSDSKENLETALNRGFYIGINGLATFANLAAYRDLTPDFLDRCLLETDAPFLTPEPNRGKINEPGYIPDIASWLANKLGVSATTVAEKTTNNARFIFNLPDPEPVKGPRA